jgi:hypothetical protein
MKGGVAGGGGSEVGGEFGRGCLKRGLLRRKYNNLRCIRRWEWKMSSGTLAVSNPLQG